MSGIWANLKPRTSAWPLMLLAITAWLGLALIGRRVGSMPGTMGLGLVAFVAVWAVMMAAMMLPSVTPFAAVYARTFDERRAARTAAFAAGYLTIWVASALPVYGFARGADALVSSHPVGATALAALTFAACGAYQHPALKDRCLA